MRSRLELQARKGAGADHPADDFPVTAVLAGTLAQDLDAPPLRFGIARVHAKEIAGKDGRFVAAGACADLEKDVVRIARILRQQELGELMLLGGEARSETFFLFFAERAGRRVRVARQILGGTHILQRLEIGPIPSHHGLEPGVLHGEFPVLGRVRRAGRVGEQVATSSKRSARRSSFCRMESFIEDFY